MSVIAAYTDGTSTWIGSDTNSTCDHANLDTGPKWFEGADGWWYGHVGSLRVANVISENIAALTGFLSAWRRIAPDPCCDDRFTPQSLPARLIELLERAHVKPFYRDETVPLWFNGGILTRPGEIWDIDPMLGMALCPEHRLVARGAGADYALGAAYAVERMSPAASPSFRVETAVLAAQEHHYGIRGLWLKQLRSGKPGLEEPVLEARAAE
jgi:hypothetical protein